ncbi:MAG: PEP-CTERM sorting domain-containing protein [Kiritimatiellae bacterium]|nr:PEP-CTERM sorting domain-containing protein [Kiritimatiellia bacterium]
MKKLLILATVALMATCSQASAWRWNASGVNDATGTNPYSGAATLYAIIDGTATVVSTANMSNGAVPNTTFSNDDLAAGTAYTFYYTMEDDAGNTFKSSEKSARAQATATVPLGFGSGGEWTVAPEPTSGLLMLLGMAGLALRRRRA